MNSPEKLALWPLLLMAGMFVIQFGLAFAAAGRPLADLIGETGVGIELVFWLGVGVVMVIQAFKIKGIIEDHATPEAEAGSMLSERVTLSGLMTFFFSIFYLQWAINRYVVGSAVDPTLHHR